MPFFESHLYALYALYVNPNKMSPVYDIAIHVMLFTNNAVIRYLTTLGSGTSHLTIRALNRELTWSSSLNAFQGHSDCPSSTAQARNRPPVPWTRATDLSFVKTPRFV